MGFKIGDRVIYPHHGAAEITKRESRVKPGDDPKQETDYFVLRTLHDEMTLLVPVDRTDDVGMRPPIEMDDVEDLFDLLAKKDIREPSNWSRRFKNHQEKLKSGDIYQVAEVVRNLALRQSSKGLSAGEKSMLEKSRQILVSELSISMKITEEDAGDQVDLRLVG
ncbi:MAG TPA: CarD family transcriptional regulator [Acidimicrobiaceae bacterium]|nr:CarD family transcriptional regulator [Acidimicrobiaceae bacterium]HCB36716.1 CarD family transcriptional regulator [Acidimicrobiaceae bacterium]